MHDIEPYYHWQGNYVASKDPRSPYYGKTHSEFYFSNKVYNYLIHPQWDEFGSQTLYTKVIYVDYDEGFAIIELIGEWNDCLNNDIMLLKQNLIDKMQVEGIHRFLLICEHVLNFHASDDCYYEEWYQESVIENNGWISFINLHPHVILEMQENQLYHYIHLISQDPYFTWRKLMPAQLILKLESILSTNKYLY